MPTISILRYMIPCFKNYRKRNEEKSSIFAFNIKRFPDLFRIVRFIRDVQKFKKNGSIDNNILFTHFSNPDSIQIHEIYLAIETVALFVLA